jgi:hypothetical protein
MPTEEATAHMLARLEKELFHVEREHTRNVAEAQYRQFRADQLRREIEHVKSGQFRVHHP